MMTLLPFHPAVMFFQRMPVHVQAGVIPPGTVIMAIAMIALITSIPAWNRPLLLMAIMLTLTPQLMTFTIVVCEFWWITPIVCMPITCDSVLRDHKANGSNRGQQQGRELNLLVHDVPPLRDFGQDYL